MVVLFCLVNVCNCRACNMTMTMACVKAVLLTTPFILGFVFTMSHLIVGSMKMGHVKYVVMGIT
jgi:hypothetical protein